LRMRYQRFSLLVTHQDWQTYRLRDLLCNNAKAKSNNGMHPTADTLLLIYLQ
jgi:hypothetical protein